GATRGAIQKVPIAVYSFKSAVAVPGQPPADVLKDDLRRSLLFEVADLERLGIRAEVNSQPKPEILQKALEAGLEVQVWGTLLPRGSQIVMDGTLFESSHGEVGRKRYVGSPGVVRHMVHRLADEIVFHYTGEQGIARSQIAFVSERDGAKELFVMDYDGYNTRRVRFDACLNMAQVWSPTGREIALTSDRGGTPQIYLMSADGTNVRALTYRDQHGSYNTSAAWSPKGDWIAYVCRDERRVLKICLISPDGQQVRQLTSGSSSDESPSWSPDGRHIAFSSTRNGRRDIYMI